MNRLDLSSGELETNVKIGTDKYFTSLLMETGKTPGTSLKNLKILGIAFSDV